MKKLNPHYVVGFIDGEGSFNVSVNRKRRSHKGLEIGAAFEIELRGDDIEILERIKETLGCGGIYWYNYPKYKWGPHCKYKIANRKQIIKHLIPFLEKYPLQAKKRKVYELFKQIVFMLDRHEHLTEKGARNILFLREKMRKIGKKAGKYYSYEDYRAEN